MSPSQPERILIIRFSSLGDIIQCSPLPTLIRRKHPRAHIIWLTREDLAQVVELIEGVDEIWTIPRSRNPLQLWRVLLKTLRSVSHVYDVHNNLRSNLLFVALRIVRVACGRPHLLQRSKERWKRFLFFKFHRRVFETPFRASVNFAKPLTHWDVTLDGIRKLPATLKKKHQSHGSKLRIGLVPGAAWSKKIWPTESFLEFVENWPEAEFIVLGGAKDEICFEIEKRLPHRVHNFAGKLKLSESIGKLAECHLVVGNDTGLLHAADHLGIRSVFIIGPSAFGYPLRETSSVAEVQLDCKPCSKDGRGPCVNAVYKKCLQDVRASDVRAQANRLLEKFP